MSFHGQKTLKYLVVNITGVWYQWCINGIKYGLKYDKPTHGYWRFSKRFLETGDPIGKPSKVSGKGNIYCTLEIRRFGMFSTVSHDLTGEHVANRNISWQFNSRRHARAARGSGVYFSGAPLTSRTDWQSLSEALRNVERWCQLSVRYWVCSQHIKHTVSILSCGWAGRWRLCGGVLSLATLPVWTQIWLMHRKVFAVFLCSALASVKSI